jgi:hypothetical protein
MNTGSHEIVPFISQDADDLCRQGFVQKFNYGFAIGAVAFGYSAVLDVLPRSLAQSFDVSEKWFICHDLTP